MLLFIVSYLVQMLGCGTSNDEVNNMTVYFC